MAVQFGLEDAHHRFGHGIVVGITDRADRDVDAEPVNAVGVVDRCVFALTAGIGVTDQSVQAGRTQRTSTLDADFVVQSDVRRIPASPCALTAQFTCDRRCCSRRGGMALVACAPVDIA